MAFAPRDVAELRPPALMCLLLEEAAHALAVVAGRDVVRTAFGIPRPEWAAGRACTAPPIDTRVQIVEDGPDDERKAA